MPSGSSSSPRLNGFSSNTPRTMERGKRILIDSGKRALASAKASDTCGGEMTESNQRGSGLTCQKCSKPAWRSNRWDLNGCPDCLIWTEDFAPCGTSIGDPDYPCWFCNGRPATPSVEDLDEDLEKSRRQAVLDQLVDLSEDIGYAELDNE